MTTLDTPGSCPKEVNFLWPASSISHNYCCIYRVPCRLRRVNPEAYTPQMLLIGPLHHSKETQSAEPSKTDLRYLDYIKMERHKMKYVENFALWYGEQTIEEFRIIIKRDEQIIRACYAESTDWIKSPDFVEMMLRDSVFILMFFMQYGPLYIDKTGDFIFDQACHQKTVFEDIILLENQLPYALLENLFEPFYAKHGGNITFRDIVLTGFEIQGKITREMKFLHFTDLCRCLRVETLGLTKEEQAIPVKKKMIDNLHNADKLERAGVKFVGFKEDIEGSLVIEFRGGILKMSCFTAEDATERIWRNIMALEQCHYSYTAFVCNYMIFLDYLIDTERDVDLLVQKGVIKNWLGRHGSVTELVNQLCLGIVDYGSQYYGIAESLNQHYNNRLKRSAATLRKVYFKDLWTGTATVTAIVLLVLTLIQTVASVLQVKYNDNNTTKSLSSLARKP